MTRNNLLLTVFATALSFCAIAQDTAADPMAKYNSTPPHKWELGVGLGHVFAPGDVDYRPGFGGSIHIRRAIDYIFSVRGEVSYMQANGGLKERRTDGYLSHKTTILSGEGQIVASLNNLLWRGQTKRYNVYAFAGAGAGQMTPKLDLETGIGDSRFLEKAQLLAHFSGGVGAAYRINSKVNIGIEHKTMVMFGKWSDYIDGYDPTTIGTTYRDIPQFTQLKLCINLGKKEGVTEPLYWLNPMSSIQDDIAELQARPKLDLTDTDGDGVIDMLDSEKDTPAGAAVNVKGVSLDSDGDGYADYKDKEPYSPPGFKVDGSGIAQVPKEPKLTEGDVARVVDDKLKNYQPKGAASAPVASLSDWFLPMIHFDHDKYGINRSEFEKLHYVATVLKNNPSVRVVVNGYTDRTAGNTYNNVLSYNRAKAAVDHLVSVYGISRDRLVLNYNGESENLVPSSGNNYMNRRVEFRVATSESDQSRPSGRNAGKPGYSGGKQGGY